MRVGAVDQSNFDKALDRSRWEIFCPGGSQRFSMGALLDRSDFPDKPAASVPVGQPLLYGPASEFMSFGSGSASGCGAVRLFDAGSHLAGCLRVPVDSSTMEERTRVAYLEVIKSVGTRSFCRIWNYVPHINHTEPAQLENYKLFCSGRNRAFAEVYGTGNTQPFSAASATGSFDDQLTVVFLCTGSPVRNWENPEQTPAYAYPPNYGPRAPSFARASQCDLPGGGEGVFISGTAAIKGHATQYPGEFAPQLETTLHNIDLILAMAGLKIGDMGRGRKGHFKVFLRNRADLDPLLRRILPILGASDSCMVVEADICRADLEVEIEVTVLPDC